MMKARRRAQGARRKVKSKSGSVRPLLLLLIKKACVFLGVLRAFAVQICFTACG